VCNLAAASLQLVHGDEEKVVHRLPGFSLQPLPQRSSKRSRAWYTTHNMGSLFHPLLFDFPISTYILATTIVILLGQQHLSADLLFHGCVLTL